jgi:hypothetical protein
MPLMRPNAATALPCDTTSLEANGPTVHHLTVHIYPILRAVEDGHSAGATAAFPRSPITCHHRTWSTQSVQFVSGHFKETYHGVKVLIL